MTALPCAPLGRALSGEERERLATSVRGLLKWQRSLGRWPAIGDAPDATAFVTLYAGGKLRGCFGSHEGAPGERLARAFLRALEDSRYGMVQPGERSDLAAVVSYVRSLRRFEERAVEEAIEPGSDGVALLAPGRRPTILLPLVARERGLGARGLLDVLRKKAALADLAGCSLFALRTEDLVVRSGQRAAARPGAEVDPRARAARWIARLVGDGGELAFAIDARARRTLPTGPMHHGRAAVALRALAQSGAHAATTRRVRAWLTAAIASSLRGQPAEGWPADPAVVAGTLALALGSGVDVQRELAAFARSEALHRSPWHRAQVVAALGVDAPDALWRACVDDLHARPWAPWTVLAARARHDAEVTARASIALCASIRSSPPHAGGCDRTPVPEIALTALVIEALDGLPGAESREATARARRFLRASQLIGDRIPAPLDARLADGAFPASPVAPHHLRCDVAGHAMLALGRSASRRCASVA